MKYVKFIIFELLVFQVCKGVFLPYFPQFNFQNFIEMVKKKH